MEHESRSSGRFSSLGQCSASLKIHAVKFSLLASVALVLAACQQQSSTELNMPQLPQNSLIVPAGFPQPVVPADNPITPAKVALGRDLFYETKLSVNNTKACASCHSVSESFSDAGNIVSTGVLGPSGSRNAPGLMNVAYDTTFFWDGRASSLEMQAGMPILNTIELGNTDSNAVVNTLNAIPFYRELFAEAFGDSTNSMTNQISFQQIRYALATFERTLISGNSDYDRFIAGDSSALSASAQRGLALFNSSATNCSVCHSGVNFTDNDYHSTGLTEFYADEGREDFTGSPEDNGKFRTPSLRNVALTAPYEHDGSMTTIKAVVDHYFQGGAHNNTQDTLVRAISYGIGSQQETDIINFLNSLTDVSFTQRADFMNPDLKE
jgi:cytochrome c peroxidase